MPGVFRLLFLCLLPLTLIGLLLVTAAVLVPVLVPVIASPDFEARRGTLVQARETGEWIVPGGRIVEVSLQSSSGLAVDLALRLPDQPLPQRPLVLMLGGQETGRQAVDLLPDTRGVTVAAISYPFGTIPHREWLALAMALPRIQRGIRDTPAAALLATDYLVSRPDIRPGRIELAGISFGAYLAAVPTALDPRIERVWLIHGSADPAAVIESGLRDRVPGHILRRSLSWLLATAASAHHLSPEYWVGRVAPRPLIAISATDDSALPASAVSALHAALRQPFEVLWSPGDHVHPKRPETIDYISNMLFERISAPDGASAVD